MLKLYQKRFSFSNVRFVNLQLMLVPKITVSISKHVPLFTANIANIQWKFTPKWKFSEYSLFCFQSSYHLPTREFLKRPDMPIRFSGDSAKVYWTAEFYQVDFRNVIHIVSFECFKMSFLAPIIYWRCAVADYFWNFACGQHIGILCKKLRVIQLHIFKNLFG